MRCVRSGGSSGMERRVGPAPNRADGTPMKPGHATCSAESASADGKAPLRDSPAGRFGEEPAGACDPIRVILPRQNRGGPCVGRPRPEGE